MSRRPIGFAAEAGPVLDEIATTAGGRDITRGFVDSLPLLPSQDRLLRGRGGGDYLLYEEILRDDQVATALQQRRRAVVSYEWEVAAGGPAAADLEAAEFLRETLKSIRWDAVTDRMLYGVFYGFAVAECLWARDGDRVVLEAVKVRKQRRFRFAPDGSLRLRTMQAPQGEVLPEKKFWAFSCGADNDDEPYGLGLAHWVYWPVFFKRNGVKFWLIFLEKFGAPTALGRYQPNATEPDKARLLEALRAIQTDAGIILPHGMEIELIEAARSGTVDYAALVDRMDASISKVIVGQTMTVDPGSSRAQAEVHLAVRQDIVKADADLVCESFNRGPAHWLTEWNFPAAAMPQVWRKVEVPADLKALAERDKTIVDMGFRPSLRYVQETYGGDWVEAQRPAAPGGAPQFAEAAQGGAVDGYVDQLEQASAEVLDGLGDRVRQLVAEADSVEQLRDRLLEVYGKMDPASLADLMQRALAAAELAGRFEASKNAG